MKNVDMNCRQFAEVHPVHPRQAQLRWPRFQSHKSNLDPGNPRMHSSKFAWLPDTLSSREYLQEKYLWMSLAKHGCTSCTMFSHKLSHVNKRQAIEGSSRMRSKGSHFTLGVWGLRVFSPDVVQPFATGLHLFFFRPPRPPLSGSVPLPLLHEVPRKFSWILRCSSTCPILPQCVLQMSSRAMDTDRFAVMVCICRDATF